MSGKDETQSISLTWDLPHAPAKVWRALTEPEFTWMARFRRGTHEWKEDEDDARSMRAMDARTSRRPARLAQEGRGRAALNPRVAAASW
jgi:uncharacterized protein YndB with AHSA1/START domain